MCKFLSPIHRSKATASFRLVTPDTVVFATDMLILTMMMVITNRRK